MCGDHHCTSETGGRRHTRPRRAPHPLAAYSLQLYNTSHVPALPLVMRNAVHQTRSPQHLTSPVLSTQHVVATCVLSEELYSPPADAWRQYSPAPRSTYGRASGEDQGRGKGTGGKGGGKEDGEGAARVPSGQGY